MSDATPPPYGSEQPYGQQGPQNFDPNYGGRGPVLAPEPHPQGTLVLILGVLGLVACGVLAPIAWIMGSKAKKETETQPQRYFEDTSLKVGRILGIVGTIFMALGLVVMVILFVFLGMFASELEDSCTTVQDGAYSTKLECGESSTYSPEPAPMGEQL